MSSDFVNRAILIHNKKYDYSNTKYINSYTKLLIICKIHGKFLQLPSNHLKYGCGSCGRSQNKRNIFLKQKCKDEFIEKANNVHKNKYNYSKTIYKTVVKKL